MSGEYLKRNILKNFSDKNSSKTEILLLKIFIY